MPISPCSGRGTLARPSSGRSRSTRPIRCRASAGLGENPAGDLDAGSRELEIAASLDPSSALVRSYLGKTYYEERRAGPLDERNSTLQSSSTRRIPPPGSTMRSRSRRPTGPSKRCMPWRPRASSTTTARSTARSCCSIPMLAAARRQPGAHLQRARLPAARAGRRLERGQRDPSNFSPRIASWPISIPGLPRHEIARVSDCCNPSSFRP